MWAKCNNIHCQWWLVYSSPLTWAPSSCSRSSPRGSSCTLRSAPEGGGEGEGLQLCPCSLAVSLRAYLESLADHAGTAVPAADGALRALVGHVLLQVARQHSLVAQVTLDLLEPTLLHVELGEGRGGGGVMYCIGGLCAGGVLTSMSFSSPLQLQPWSVLWHRTFTLEISLRLTMSG